MPEGDTVHLSARRLHGRLAGEVVTRSDLRVPRYATADLSGLCVDEVVARGKHILFRFDNHTSLHTHFKMEGEWHLYKVGDRWRAPGREARVVLETKASVAVGFRLGSVHLLPTERESEVVGHLGPDLLGPDWDHKAAVASVAAEGARPIGEVLLDQRVMAGLGNIYRSEICFLLGLHPDTPVGAVGDLDRVVSLAKRVMEANHSTGMQITTGDDRPGRRHWVYGRRDEPCRRCGTPVFRREDAGERVVYWCPSCQPKGTSDGRSE
ncbi:MAG: Fpg/Nei family DNA glycosylase [Actinomycetota bacterium]|nr:Fpg/Nei family DNA glycosylase [Actinomycetota bacterium]